MIDNGLLEEVTGLVEWPVALTGRFEERFFVRATGAHFFNEAEHQKYFHVVNDAGGYCLISSRYQY